jgi:hypothetical protein
VWILPLLVLFAPSTQPQNCQTLYQRYQQLLEEAITRTGPTRKQRIYYLKTMERTSPRCFEASEGKRLVAERESLEKKKPPRPVPRRRPVKKDPSPDKSVFPSVGAKKAKKPMWYPHPGAAALFSLVLPGGGLALQGRVGLAWLFFLGVAASFTTANVILAVAMDEAAKDSSLKIADGTWIAYGIIMGIGGVLHIVNVILAATWKTPPE